MSAYGLSVTCPSCGGDVAHVNGNTNGLLSVAIVACGGCNRQWEVHARLAPHAASQIIRSRADRERARVDA